MSNIISRKVQLYPVGDQTEVDRVYTYLRDGIENQNRAMNQYMSALYYAAVSEATSEDRKELNHLFSRISSSRKGSAYPIDIEFAKGLPTGASISQKVKQDFDSAMKKGLMYGRLSLPTYRDKNPLLVHVDYVRLKKTNPHVSNGLYHNYVNDEEFLKHLYRKDAEVLLKFANGITFKVVFGNPRRSCEIRNVFEKIFDETYEVNSSSIQIDGNKIILNLSLTIPDSKKELDENTVVGVDLGIAVPAVCALNNSPAYKYLGSVNDFLRVRTRIQAQRRRLQRDLKFTSGGHGRTKKLKSLDRFSDYESNWVQTYNHKISHDVVDFALKNNAKYINLEDLSGYGREDKQKDDSQKENKKDSFILRNWSYYQLQQYITYKAKKYGIEVRKVNPYHTSQDCSECGQWMEGQRVSQSTFICKNPECSKFGEVVNADYNAARNIAKSTNFSVDKKERKNKKRDCKDPQKNAE